jgi:hypothetical protein
VRLNLLYSVDIDDDAVMIMRGEERGLDVVCV